MAEELIQELVASSDSVSMTIGLYTGNLVRKEDRLYFIAERFSEWKIVEECAQEDIVKIERIENFMGVRYEIEKPGTKWICKDVAADVDLATFLGLDLTTPIPTPTPTPTPTPISTLPIATVLSDPGPVARDSFDTASSDAVVKDIVIDSSKPVMEQIQSAQSQHHQVDSAIRPPVSEDPSSSFSRTEVVRIRTHIQSHPRTWDSIRMLLGKDYPSGLNLEEDDKLETFIQANPSVFEALSKRLAAEDGDSNVFQQSFLERIMNFEGLSEREQLIKVVVIVGLLLLFVPADIIWSLISLLISFAF